MKIAIIGHGVVGSCVVEVFEKSRVKIRARTGQELEIKYILDVRDFSALPYADKFISDFETIVEDPEIGIVVEAIGGLDPAYRYVRSCLEHGKNVVTSNKELVAEKGAELLATAAEKNVNFLFEASVGGGIPIIRPLHQCLNASEITEIAGILNGTTNYILTKMFRDRSSFSDALAEAQSLGYAERDPAADVEGLDACRKICILASLAFGRSVYPREVPTEGITAITSEDVEYAANHGRSIKLIAGAKRLEFGKIAVETAPALVSGESQLAGVSDVFNGILVRSEATGDVVFYGRGAGGLPTASSVVSDIIDAARAHGTIATLSWRDPPAPITADISGLPTSYYLRFAGISSGDALALFPNAEPLWRSGAPADESALITPPIPRRETESLIKKAEASGAALLSKIRVFE